MPVAVQGMTTVQPEFNQRFQIALDRARADWAAADPAVSCALAGCTYTKEGVVMPFFGVPHMVTHPSGEVIAHQGDARKAAHSSIMIVLLHYLLTADGTRPADRWVAFRELPDGLFYAQAFAGHAEGLLAQRYSADLEAFQRAASASGGMQLDLADASFRFQVLPRLAVAVLLWSGDEEFPGQARILFDASAGHYLPTEDLSGIGDWLAHRLAKG
jgi:Domain of unknown function (DUF3786)